MSNVATDTAIVVNRELRPVVREPATVIFSVIQPLFFLLLFAPLLPETPGGGSPLQWFVPGVVVMSCLFGTSLCGANLLMDMQTGAHERLLVTPLRRSSLLIGRALKEAAPIVIQTAILVLVCIPFGFRPNAPGAVLGLVILAVFCVGLGALSYALALASKDADWLFWTVQQTLLFPLLLLSGMLLPLSNGPGWLQALSKVNPLTYVVDAERALFNGDFLAGSVAAGTVAALVVAALGLFVGTRSMQRAT
jgi:ABC-2 type transport system permease protein